MTQQEFHNRYIYNIRTDLLGEGGFGSVYKAEDTVRNRWVAIKVSKVQYKSGKEFSLKEELKAVKHLDEHSNIAFYEDVFSFQSPDGEYDFAVLQYYPDGNLHTLLKNTKLSFEQKETILVGILNGLDFLHNNKIVHRDIKPANILISVRSSSNIDAKYIPKITDFGLSKVAEPGKSSVFDNSVVGGTYAYSSPEQLRGNTTIRFNTDFWSFGAIVYQVFTGKTMFEADSNTAASAIRDQEIIQKVLNEDLTLKISQVPEQWQSVMKLCMVREPQQRVKNAQGLLMVVGNGKLDKTTIENIPISNQTKQDKNKTIVENHSTTKPRVASNTNKKSKKTFWIIGTIGIFFFLMFLIVLFQDNNKVIVQKTIIPYSIDSLFGYKYADSPSGIWHIAPKYLTAEKFTNGKAKVTTKDSVYFIDENGKMIEFVKLVSNVDKVDTIKPNTEEAVSKLTNPRPSENKTNQANERKKKEEEVRKANQIAEEERIAKEKEKERKRDEENRIDYATYNKKMESAKGQINSLNAFNRTEEEKKFYKKKIVEKLKEALIAKPNDAEAIRLLNQYQ